MHRALRHMAWANQQVYAAITTLPDEALGSYIVNSEWTAAEIRQRAHGDADAVSFGDYHVAKDVGWALTGELFDDEQMREFLEPWRPHRGRIPTMIALGGLQRPRRGARMAPRTHLPAKVTRYP